MSGSDGERKVAWGTHPSKGEVVGSNSVGHIALLARNTFLCLLMSLKRNGHDSKLCTGRMAYFTMKGHGRSVSLKIPRNHCAREKGRKIKDKAVVGGGGPGEFKSCYNM